MTYGPTPRSGIPEPVSPGFSDFDLAALEARFVASFPGSQRRSVILSRFLALVDYLRSLGVSCVAWLDGSFLTEKVEPDDIDVVLLMDNVTLRRLSPAALDSFKYLVDNNFETKLRYLTDLYAVDDNDFHNKAYWKGLFSFSRGDIFKGIARVRI